MTGCAALIRLLITASALLSASGKALAADASAWSDDTRSSIRVVAGQPIEGKPTAGIEIKLQPGWKTYWRTPGDSGVPPRFDFGGSDNLARAKVEWPAPHAFSDEAGTSIGYKDGVVFPLRITPRDPARPVRLKLKLNYAVCEKICIPAEGRAELLLDGSSKISNAALAAAWLRVPQPTTAKDMKFTAKRIDNGPRPLVFVELAGKPGERIEIFVEGPSDEWSLPIPKAALGAPAGYRHFEFQLDGLAPGVDPKAKFNLTFTVVKDNEAYEFTSHLD